MTVSCFHMIDAETKNTVVEELLKGSDFKAQRYQALLSFLVAKTIIGEETNETILAHEVFGKQSFDPLLDSSVRTYISNLRKKLEHYYLTEGKNSSVQLVFPKGGYKVEFVQIENRNVFPRSKNSRLPYMIFVPVICILLVFVVFLGADRLSFEGKKKQFIPKNDPIWHELFESRKISLWSWAIITFFRCLWILGAKPIYATQG